MSSDDLERLKQKWLSEYLEANRLSADEFLKRTQEQYRTYIIGQIELLQSQIKSAIQTGNDMMVAFNKSLIDAWFNMLRQNPI